MKQSLLEKFKLGLEKDKHNKEFKISNETIRKITLDNFRRHRIGSRTRSDTLQWNTLNYVVYAYNRLRLYVIKRIKTYTNVNKTKRQNNK